MIRIIGVADKEILGFPYLILLQNYNVPDTITGALNQQTYEIRNVILYNFRRRFSEVMQE